MQKISVIIPIYNVEKFLDRTIPAVLNQTYSNLEVILVDDGSTDNSGKIIDDYAKKDDRIRVIHKENGGSSTARNAGIEVATGDYIGFPDSDDWLELDMYENLIKAISNHPGCKMAEIMSRDYDTEGNMVKAPLKNSGNTVLQTTDEVFKELMLHTGDSSFCTKIIEASLMKKYRFLEHELNEDFELLIRMLPDLQQGIVTVEKPGYNIELRGGSNTRGKYNQKFYEAMMKNADICMKKAEEDFPELVEYAKRFWIVQASFFLLNIPVDKMTKDNEFYIRIRNRVRSKEVRNQIKNNLYIEKKIRRNMRIISTFPTKGIRRIHQIIMKMRGIEK